MSLVGLLVFLVVIGTIGAVMLLTHLIDREAPDRSGVIEGRGMLPAQRAAAAADVAQPEAGLR
jgi:hypothetical protein